MSEADAEIVLGEGEALRYFDLRISPLYRRHGDLAVAGRLIVLTDITERKQAEGVLRGPTIRLEVQDWGCGFEPLTVLKEASLGEHIGLREMRERVELVGGQLMISSRPGIGTLVVAEVPLLAPDIKSH